DLGPSVARPWALPVADGQGVDRIDRLHGHLRVGRVRAGRTVPQRSRSDRDGDLDAAARRKHPSRVTRTARVPLHSRVREGAALLIRCTNLPLSTSHAANTGGKAGFQAVPSPVDGLLVFLAFLTIVLGLSWVLFEKRDA